MRDSNEPAAASQTPGSGTAGEEEAEPTLARRAALARLRTAHSGQAAATDVAYWTLRDAMRSGVLPAGERLIEVELADAFEMSRTPVREALRRLEAQRLIENLPRRGLVVPTITLDDLVEIYEIRGVLEGLAARRAAERMGAFEIETLGSTVDRMNEALASSDFAALSEASSLFHVRLRSGSRHARLPGLISLIYDTHRSLAVHEFASQERATKAVAEHRAIYEAIARHDAGAAESLAREHSINALRAQMSAHELETSR